MTTELELLLAYLDGSLPADEVARLQSRLKTERALGELLILACRDEAIIREWAATVPVDTSEPAQPGGLPSRFSGWRLVRYATAAAVLLATGLAIYFATSRGNHEVAVKPPEQIDQPADAGPVVARLEDVQGEAFLVVGETATRIQAGQEIHAGQQVRTNDGGTAVVRLPDSTRLELGADTLVMFGKEDASARFVLTSGYIHADVPAQTSGQPLVFATPHTTISADGSRFSSMAIGDMTGVEMDSGSVDMTTKAGEHVHVPEGRFAVAGLKNGAVSNKAMPARITKPRDSIAVGTGPVRGVKASPVGNLVAINTWDGHVAFYDLAKRTIEPWLGDKQKTISDFAFSLDGKWLASAGEDRFAKVTRIGEPAPTLVLPRQKVGVRAVAMSPDGAVLATACAAATGADVFLWDARTGKPIGSWSGHPDRVDAIAFHPSKNLAVTACRDGMLRVWDTVTLKLVETISAHNCFVQAIAFAPDGKTLASGGRDGLVKLWDVDSWKARAVLEGHLQDVCSLAFSPDGKHLASAGISTTIWLWNSETGEAVRTYVGHKYKVTGVSFSADGRTLLTSGWDRTVKLWDLEPVDPR